MQITTILAFITAMGGLEAVKWLVRYITCRKTDARKEEASVNSMEEENRRKKVDWLEERLTQRDEKIDGLYIELRKEQEEKIDWIHKCHEVELIQKESEVKKCEIRGCCITPCAFYGRFLFSSLFFSAERISWKLFFFLIIEVIILVIELLIVLRI